MATLSGSILVLRNWFCGAKEVNGKEHDDIRDEVLNEMSKATRLGIEDTQVALETPNGYVVLTKCEGEDVVVIEFQRKGHCGLCQFWMNTDSITHLKKEWLDRKVPKTSFEAIYVGAA